MYLCAYNIIYFVIICILLLYTHEDAFYYSVGFSGDKTTGGEGRRKAIGPRNQNDRPPPYFDYHKREQRDSLAVKTPRR